MHKIDEIIRNLKNYQSPLFKAYNGIIESKITEFQKKIDFELPIDFMSFLKITNGAIILYETIYGIYDETNPNDLYRNYLTEKNEVGNPIPKYFLPIYPDGYGNHYCLCLQNNMHNSFGEVIFWQHDMNNNKTNVIASSFTNFLYDLYCDITKEYNYDGTERSI